MTFQDGSDLEQIPRDSKIGYVGSPKQLFKCEEERGKLTSGLK